ncbi:MAG: hypothetical protein HYZ36_02890, partial [Pedosphaera parvula]|nr:hypothetical protein [Pedosphaera parvula]
MNIEIIFLLGAASFALFLIAVTRFEKQYVKEYVPAGEGEPADPSPYFAALNAAAETLG